MNYILKKIPLSQWQQPTAAKNNIFQSLTFHTTIHPPQLRGFYRVRISSQDLIVKYAKHFHHGCCADILPSLPLPPPSSPSHHHHHHYPWGYCSYPAVTTLKNGYCPSWFSQHFIPYVKLSRSFFFLFHTQTHIIQPAGFDLWITAQTETSQSVSLTGRPRRQCLHGSCREITDAYHVLLSGGGGGGGRR